LSKLKASFWLSLRRRSKDADAVYDCDDSDGPLVLNICFKLMVLLLFNVSIIVALIKNIYKKWSEKKEKTKNQLVMYWHHNQAIQTNLTYNSFTYKKELDVPYQLVLSICSDICHKPS
jgi:hypothetical protein